MARRKDPGGGVSVAAILGEDITVAIEHPY